MPARSTAMEAERRTDWYEDRSCLSFGGMGWSDPVRAHDHRSVPLASAMGATMAAQIDHMDWVGSRMSKIVLGDMIHPGGQQPR